MAKPKRILKRILRVLAIVLAVPLALIILLAAVPFAASIGLQQEALPADASTVLRRAVVGERWMTGAARLLDGLTPMPRDIPGVADYRSERFYPGGESAGEAWQLGYAQAIITPEDWETKTYYEGGNISIPTRKLKHKLDEIKVRVIALSAGDGVNIFAAVDSIGVTNRQVRQIRALVADLDLQSVNIAATHAHSAVDSTGIYSKGGKADEEYLAFANEKTAQAIRAAVASMEQGKLWFSQIGSHTMEAFWDRFDEKLGFDDETDEWNDEWDEKWDQVYAGMLRETSIGEYGLRGYVSNRRIGGLYPTVLNKLRFAPENPESKETVLLNFAAHPFRAGWKYGDWTADSISGDFIYYMEELVNQAGANMIFVNGAVNGINPNMGGTTPNFDSYEAWEAFEAEQGIDNGWYVRMYGRDVAGIALAMTMEPGEIAQNEQTDPGNHPGWAYQDIITVMQNNGTIQETELPPMLNIQISEVQVNIENPVIRWAAKRGALNMNILRDGKNLLGPTEIGLLELGGAVSVVLAPGEFTPGLAWRGIDTIAENAIRQRDFAYPTFSESAGREVLVFGLCNDELGYVIPDSDYLMFYVPDFLVDSLMGTWNYDHYAELLSPGPGAAEVFAQAFAQLADKK